MGERHRRRGTRKQGGGGFDRLLKPLPPQPGGLQSGVVRGWCSLHEVRRDFLQVQLLPKFICRDILMGPYLAFLSLRGGHGYDFFPRTGQANFELGDVINV